VLSLTGFATCGQALSCWKITLSCLFASDYHSVSIFHPLRCKKSFFFCVFEATIYRSFCTFRCPSASIRTAPNFFVFESFQWPSNIWKSLIDQHLMILQILLAFESDLERVKLSHLQTFSASLNVPCLPCQNHLFCSLFCRSKSVLIC